jgi:hypothetical protein
VTDPRDRKRQSRERAKRDAARSDAITRARRAAESAQPYRHAEVVRLARAEQMRAAAQRRAAMQREREEVAARIQAELEAEKSVDPAKAAELRRLRKRLANATRREAERQRLREALSTVRTWAQPWPPLTERMRHARDEARMWRAIVLMEVES